MIHFLDESSLQKLSDLFVDSPVLLLIETEQALLHWLGAWLDLQGVSKGSISFATYRPSSQLDLGV